MEDPAVFSSACGSTEKAREAEIPFPRLSLFVHPTGFAPQRISVSPRTRKVISNPA